MSPVDEEVYYEVLDLVVVLDTLLFYKKIHLYDIHGNLLWSLDMVLAAIERGELLTKQLPPFKAGKNSKYRLDPRPITEPRGDPESDYRRADWRRGRGGVPHARKYRKKEKTNRVNVNQRRNK